MMAAAFPAAAFGRNAETEIFESGFRTLRFTRADDLLASPTIRLGSADRLSLSFDEMVENPSDLCARLVHLNADGSESRLLENEFADGFNVVDIDDYAYSTNTFCHFINYRLDFPQPGLSPLVSGIYLVEVFDRDDPERVLLQGRFSVVEPQATLSGDITTRTDRGTNSEWQQLEVQADLKDYRVGNPYADLILTVEQNNVPASRRSVSSPLRIQGSEVIYAHTPQLIFPAGNEYRRFETVRTTFPGMDVDSVGYSNGLYHAWLKVDSDRSEHEYVYDQTQYGRFFIREYNATDSDLAADYVMVHFTLDFPELIDADIYVDGDLTLHRLDETSRMTFDTNNRLYRLEMPLKQGSYNYRYVAVPRGGNASQADASPVEGNKYETSNQYTLSLWHRAPGARADRLIQQITICCK